MARPTQDSYPDNIVPLFGILSKSAKEKENCHFCLYEITKNEIHTMDTLCCNHAMHCNCFEEWKKFALAKKKTNIQLHAHTAEHQYQNPNTTSYV